MFFTQHSVLVLLKFRSQVCLKYSVPLCLIKYHVNIPKVCYTYFKYKFQQAHMLFISYRLLETHYEGKSAKDMFVKHVENTRKPLKFFIFSLIRAWGYVIDFKKCCVGCESFAS